MKTHQEIDKRSRAMAKEIADRIDADPNREGIKKAIETCSRWEKRNPNKYNREWLAILDKPWEIVRSILLEESEEGQRLRQNNPFCRVLTPKERWNIYRKFIQDEKKRS